MTKIKMDKKWDFKGWATRYNVKCGDERVIKDGAFKDNDKQTVPLVWNHNHKDADNVLGHVLLEHRLEGMYAYGKFNKTPQGKNAKELVQNGDVTAMSVYANKLKQKINDVYHGNIREVSLVLAGSNPGAVIDAVMIHGSDGTEAEFEGRIWNNADIELLHSDNQENSEDDNPDQPDLKGPEDTNKKPPKEEESTMAQAEDKTIQDVFDELNEEQQKMVYVLINLAQEEQAKTMKQNAFDDQEDQEENVLTHAEFLEAVKDAKKNGSLKDAFLAHGITDIDRLFPEVQGLNQTPELISRPMEWVSTVMSGVSKSPFSRVKSTAANLTADGARAKGYVKGAQKLEEVITALKRVTTPTTVYKFQKIDRDDVIDITDFDVILFLKAEMKVMLDEELARAFIIGDGRAGSAEDKINPLNIRPIYGDDPVYTVVRTLTPASDATVAVKTKAFIGDIVRSRKFYKGSGSPIFITTEDQLVEMLLLEDTNGRAIYETVDKLKIALRVKDIVTCPVMEGVNRVVSSDQFDLLGILVNLTDYSVGSDRGGEVSLFDDFDLNFNKLEYLIETRCSAALKRPYSAIVYESKGAVVSG